jgi:hypothetical protein
VSKTHPLTLSEETTMTPCTIWSGSVDSQGYGREAGVERRAAHRVAFERAHGPIPAGLVVDHRCFNRACVNPDHLRAVTVKANVENRAGLNRNNTSGYRGVSLHSSGRWWASVRHNGRRISCGYHRTAEAAAEAARLKRVELFEANELDRAA